MKLIYLHDLEIGRLKCAVVNKLKASVSVSGGVCALVEDVWLAREAGAAQCCLHIQADLVSQHL